MVAEISKTDGNGNTAKPSSTKASYKRWTIGLLVTAALVAAAYLYRDRIGGASHPEIANDRSDIRQDRQDVARDRHDLQVERRDLRHDVDQEHHSFFDFGGIRGGIAGKLINQNSIPGRRPSTKIRRGRGLLNGHR